MTREQLVAIVTERMAGSVEAARHTHIECFCPGYVHRQEQYVEGCFCPECASETAVKLGYPSTDVKPENEGPDDNPQWCQSCDRLITLRSTPDLSWGIRPDGALEELQYFESDLGKLSTPDCWRVFLLVVDAIVEEHLPRIQAIVERAQ